MLDCFKDGGFLPSRNVIAVLGGLVTWISCEMLVPAAILPPQLAGLIASVAGMLLGGLVPRAQLRST